MNDYEKSNEITAIPKLLGLLDVKGAMVSMDAMGCQKEIAKKIVDGGGDCVLTVKDNQEHLKDDIVECLVHGYDNDFENVQYDTYETEEEGHGRQEKRVYEVIQNPEGIRDQKAGRSCKWLGHAIVSGPCMARRAMRHVTLSAARVAQPNVTGK